MVYLSKSIYCGLWQCPKIAWMKKYKPEELNLNGSVVSRMEAGNEVGDLAMWLFGDYVEVTAYKNDKLDLSKMMQRTREEMQKGTPVICVRLRLNITPSIALWIFSKRRRTAGPFMRSKALPSTKTPRMTSRYILRMLPIRNMCWKTAA